MSCHDNLLNDLYWFGPNTFTLYKEINDKPYLVTFVKGRGYEIGFRTKIPNNLLIKNDVLVNFQELSDEEQDDIINKLKDKLYFTNTEKFIINILLDKFLINNKENIEISFKEMEKYRKKVSSYKNVTISNPTYKRYCNILTNLCNKEIYLKTDDNFRAKKYGVNNRHFHQKVLNISKLYKYGTNNLVLSYSFDAFGNVLRLSRRYSNIIPEQYYHCNFSQGKINMVAYYLGRLIYIELGAINKKKYSYVNPTIKLNLDDMVNFINSDKKTIHNKTRELKIVVNLAKQFLNCMERNKVISDYSIEYTYNETEKFQKKHEFDYDINYNLDYEFTSKDIGEDVYVAITIYFYSFEEKAAGFGSL